MKQKEYATLTVSCERLTRKLLQVQSQYQVALWQPFRQQEPTFTKLQQQITALEAEIHGKGYHPLMEKLQAAPVCWQQTVASAEPLTAQHLYLALLLSKFVEDEPTGQLAAAAFQEFLLCERVTGSPPWSGRNELKTKYVEKKTFAMVQQWHATNNGQLEQLLTAYGFQESVRRIKQDIRQQQQQLIGQQAASWLQENVALPLWQTDTQIYEDDAYVAMCFGHGSYAYAIEQQIEKLFGKSVQHNDTAAHHKKPVGWYQGASEFRWFLQDIETGKALAVLVCNKMLQPVAVAVVGSIRSNAEIEQPPLWWFAQDTDTIAALPDALQQRFASVQEIAQWQPMAPVMLADAVIERDAQQWKAAFPAKANKSWAQACFPWFVVGDTPVKALSIDNQNALRQALPKTVQACFDAQLAM